MQGAWLVYSSQSLPFLATLPTLLVGQGTGVVLPGLLTSLCCAGTFQPHKKLTGALIGGHGLAGACVPAEHQSCARAAECQLLQQSLLEAEICVPEQGNPAGGRTQQADAGLGRGV